MNVIPPLLGGLLIGASASLLLAFNGRVAGVSGVVGGLLTRQGDRGWRVAFLAGLCVGGALIATFFPAALVSSAGVVPVGLTAAGGLLVGFGTQLGNGCTSGHGVCGISRLSKRSIVATMMFMCTGALATFVIQHLVLGGSR